MTRAKLWELQNETATSLDKILAVSDLRLKLGDYRKLLLGVAEGRVLETSVGSSYNLRHYPIDKALDITAVDYSPNALAMALKKDSKYLKINYKLEDVER